jgi:hypothetical protein
MLKNTKILLALAIVTATPGTAYAAPKNSGGEMCVFTFHSGGYALMSCFIGKFR